MSKYIWVKNNNFTVYADPLPDEIKVLGLLPSDGFYPAESQPIPDHAEGETIDIDSSYTLNTETNFAILHASIHIPTLVELQTKKIEDFYLLFRTELEQTVWVDNKGYDAHPEDQLNFLAAMKRAEINGSSNYKVYTDPDNLVLKEFIPHTAQMFNSVLIAAGNAQELIYIKFITKRAAVLGATLETINSISWNS